MSDYFETRERLRGRYVAAPPVHGEPLADGFLTEVAGRVILTAPATTIHLADELPKELAERWEQASHANPYMLWLQGRFVEAEKANRNGTYWSTEDLQFGEMSVRHGPLNWLHEESTVIGTIADNALIMPEALSLQQVASTSGVTDPRPRPYIAAVSAVWKWVQPEKAHMVERAAEMGRLYYSMECVAAEISCQSDDTHSGCGQSFEYMQAMTKPEQTCEHLAGRTSARRMVQPAFLGGAVIVPPTQPGWSAANVEVIKQAASMAEQVPPDGQMSDSQWEMLMRQVVQYATR